MKAKYTAILAPFVQVDEPESCDHGVSLLKHCGQCAWLDRSQLNEEMALPTGQTREGN